jgi:hypothetical protein
VDCGKLPLRDPVQPSQASLPELRRTSLINTFPHLRRYPRSGTCRETRAQFTASEALTRPLHEGLGEIATNELIMKRLKCVTKYGEVVSSVRSCFIGRHVEQQGDQRREALGVRGAREQA